MSASCRVILCHIMSCPNIILVHMAILADVLVSFQQSHPNPILTMLRTTVNIKHGVIVLLSFVMSLVNSDLSSF